MTHSRPSAPPSPLGDPRDPRNRKHRGPINKRACQKCRQGKVKCDGNAETNSTCSNCDPGQCHYDQSPRKNKQVETLKRQIDTIAAQLETSKKAIETFKKRDSLQERQDEVIKTLTQRVDFFVGRLDVFKRLMTLLVDGHYYAEMLVLIDALLSHFDTQQQPVNEIINHLERWAEICARLPKKNALRNIINPSEQAKSLTDNFRAAAQGQLGIQMPPQRPSPPPSVQHSPTAAPTVRINGLPLSAVLPTQNTGLSSPGIGDDTSSHSSFGAPEEYPHTPLSVSPTLGGPSSSPSSPVSEYVAAAVDNTQCFDQQQQHQSQQLQLQLHQQEEEGQQQQHQSLHLQHHHHQQQQQQHILQQQHHQQQQELLNPFITPETPYLIDPTTALLSYGNFSYQNFDNGDGPRT